jgi:aminopeptidase N
MMNYKNCIRIIAMVIVAYACKNTKNTTVTKPVAVEETTIPLDTVNIVANQPPKKEVYRASNTRLNDILHTKLEVDFDWNSSRMNGRASLLVTPYFYSTNMLYLNARGMEIKSVNMVSQIIEKPIKGESRNVANHIYEQKESLKYKYENDSLKIELGKEFKAGEEFWVQIDYVAKPNELKSVGGSSAIMEDKGLYFINPKGENPYKMPQIWTQGETQANSVWMPTIDSPNERMTQEILMTVDDKYTTLSNGSLVSSVKQPNGKRIDHWKLDQPHAPYLAMMSVGEFKKITDEPWQGKEVSYYVEKEYEPYAKEIFGLTKEMINFYSEKLGVPYEWPKYSQIAVRDYVSGAMENTSSTLHGDFMVYQTSREMIDSKKGESVIAHELFHQWFGDLVTCESWSNLPLNESFATYGEYLWTEYKHGRDAADFHHNNSRQGYMHSNKEVDVIRFNYNDKEDMFDAFSYNKGGQILHMLRKAVGDEAFFASLKNYLLTNKFKPVEIHNLRLAFEETTGSDLNWFFNQWFLNKGRPKLKVTKSFNSTINAIELTVEQNQDFKIAPLYKLPLEIDLYVNGKVERKHIEITEQKQTFTLAVAANPSLVNFDAERQLLCELDYQKSKEEYVFQYRSAPLWEDRFEALKELDKFISEPEIFSVYKEAATNDKYHHMRNFAISKFDKAPASFLPEIKTILISIYQKDSKTTTRTKALNALNKKFLNDPEIIELNKTALKEQSYAICSEALDAISKTDVNQAMKHAKMFEKEYGKDIMFTVANLYSNNGGDSEIKFFHDAIKYLSGFEFMTFSSAYSKTAKRCNSPENAIMAATDLEYISKGANKYVKFAAVKGINDLVSVWEKKEASVQSNIEAAKKENKPVSEMENELKKIHETKETLTQIHARAK